MESINKQINGCTAGVNSKLAAEMLELRLVRRAVLRLEVLENDAS